MPDKIVLAFLREKRHKSALLVAIFYSPTAVRLATVGGGVATLGITAFTAYLGLR